jgi:hypothetical protein
MLCEEKRVTKNDFKNLSLEFDDRREALLTKLGRIARCSE